jgi:hydrogenase maturation factor HypF (carbamoyltransferase family)
MSERKNETFELFGETLPRWEMCKTCGKEYACWFNGLIYDQPCDECKGKPEYEEQLAKDKIENQKMKHINDAVKGRLPVAVHEFKGRYLYTNHKGDVIKEEKARPMAPREKYTK